MSAFCLSFGVNFFSTGLFELPYLTGIIKTLIGFVICIGTLVFIAKSYLKAINKQIVINGFIVYDKNKKEIVIVPEYLGSIVICSAINSGVTCNSSIKQDWYGSHLVEYNEEFIKRLANTRGPLKVEPMEWITNDSTSSAAVINEFLQYDMIQALVSQINVGNSNKHIKTKKLDSKNAPDFLKSNRFFSLFTDEALYEENIKKYGSATYQRFNSIIPSKCFITISDDNEIIIKDSFYKLKIKSWFSESTSVPDELLVNYLGVNSRKGYCSYSINISVEVKFGFSVLFSNKRKAYIKWIDEYLEHLNYYYSTDDFLERIQWTSFNAMANYFDRINKKRLHHDQL